MTRTAFAWSIFLAAIAAPAGAQEATGTAGLRMVCFARDELRAMLLQQGGQLVAAGPSDDSRLALELWMRGDGRWLSLYTYGSARSCVIGEGTDLDRQPAQPALRG